MRKAEFMGKGKGKKRGRSIFRLGWAEEESSILMEEAILFVDGEGSIGLLRARGRDVARFGNGGLENFPKRYVVLARKGFASFVFGGGLDCFVV